MSVGGGELLGRDAQHGRLRELLARAASGVRSVALVSGPAGIGKSSLVRAAIGDVELLGWGTSAEAVAAPGYWPWSRALDAIATAIGPVAVAATAGDDAPLLALIGRRFGPAAPSEGSERDRLLLMDAVSRWLVRLAAERGPVVIVLDDLQWADESSLALLEFVTRDPAPAGLALIGCYRHDELTPVARRRLSQLAMSASSIELGGLDRAAVEVLAEQTAGSLSAVQVDELFRRAGGHPVFTRELALLTQDGAGAHLLPAAVRDAIEYRLVRLQDGTREVLEVAALATTPLAVDVIADAGSLSPTRVVDALAEGRSVGIASMDPDGRVQFAHDLYRETIAASIPADRRVALHRQLGVTLADRAASGIAVHPADLAHHFTAAVVVGEATQAARWALAAAATDVESLAFGEAAAHLRRWREAVAASRVTTDPRQHTSVLLAEADALARAGSVEEARARLRTAQVLTSPPDLVDLRAEVALAFADLGARASTRRDDVLQGLADALAAVEGVDADLEARLTARLARELQHSVAADRPRAVPLSERAIALGRAGGSPGTLVTCLLARHDVLWIPGAPTERIDVAREMVAVAGRSGDEERLAQGNLLLANALLESGSAAFEPALAECLRALDRLGQPRHRYTAATRRAAILLLRGDLEAADAAIQDAAELGASMREPDADNVRMSQRLELVGARATPHDLLEFAEAAANHWTGAPIHAHAIAAGFCARAGDLPAARHHATIVADLGSWRADPYYFWSVGVRELAIAAIALDDRATCEALLADLAPIATTCGVNGAVVAFAGSHGHIAGLLA
ncbi:MAG TPA: AAA family ATPase, partial [Acidimicrobiales bacterium]|nr:AAA family ATPase [Acidimicrobiales bacterium]